MNLCKERELQAQMSDAEFWDHVFNPDGGPEPADGDDEWWLPEDEMFRDACRECGAAGACGYDEYDRPWTHAKSKSLAYSDGVYEEDD